MAGKYIPREVSRHKNAVKQTALDDSDDEEDDSANTEETIVEPQKTEVARRRQSEGDQDSQDSSWNIVEPREMEIMKQAKILPRGAGEESSA